MTRPVGDSLFPCIRVPGVVQAERATDHPVFRRPGSDAAKDTSRSGSTISGAGIAGAVVGSIAGLAILAAIIYFAIIRPRRIKQVASGGLNDSKMWTGKPELHGDSSMAPGLKGELDAGPRSPQELDAAGHFQSLSSPPLAEMPAEEAPAQEME